MQIQIIKEDFEKRCTGCGACFNICPTDAITMKLDKDGFLKPYIDSEKCILCHMCEKVCPVNNPIKNSNNENPECMAMLAKDDVRLTSASGGVFTVAAKYILSIGGYVCGAAYNSDWSVSHKYVSDISKLEPLRSSKYVQSDTEDTFRQTKELLSTGKIVLYSGCPCQIAGLNSFLGKKYDNLITMDLVCHGVPSYKLYKKYLKEIAKGREIVSINFRDKEKFGWSTPSSIKFNNNETYTNNCDRDIFYRAFLPCLAVMESCAVCPFSVLPRQGDITIGDFWGIRSFDNSLDDSKGTSVILINNAKGNDFIKATKQEYAIVREVPIEVALKVNKTIVAPFRAHSARKRFFEEIDYKPLDELVPKCLTHKYDVGIVGLWFGLNYGSVLTYFALYKTINSLGKDAIMINKPPNMWIDRYIDRNTVSNRFIYKNCNVSNLREKKQDLRNLNDHCDAFVVGSDVVWNYEICGRSAELFFFLDFVNDDKKKISFSSSFGSGFNAPVEHYVEAKEYLNRFDYVSVREKEAVDICMEKFDVVADRVLDPVFLCDFSIYSQIASQSVCDEKQPFIFSYMLGAGTGILNDILDKVKNIYNQKINLLVNLNDVENSKKTFNISSSDNIDVEDWLYYMENCNFFVGNSFHGLCFAIIMRKPFMIAISKNLPSKCRFDTLLSLLGLEDRLYLLDDPISNIEKICKKEIIYDKVYEKLNSHISISKDWLKNSLNGEKRSFPTFNNLKIREMQNSIINLENKIDELLKQK